MKKPQGVNGRQSLICKIREAFPLGVPPGANDVLYRGHYIGDTEVEEIRAFFAGRRWCDITPGHIRTFKSATSFLSDDAFYYFAPAYMIGALVDEVGVDTAVDSFIGKIEV